MSKVAADLIACRGDGETTGRAAIVMPEAVKQAAREAYVRQFGVAPESGWGVAAESAYRAGLAAAAQGEGGLTGDEAIKVCGWCTQEGHTTNEHHDADCEQETVGPGLMSPCGCADRARAALPPSAGPGGGLDREALEAAFCSVLDDDAGLDGLTTLGVAQRLANVAIAALTGGGAP